MGERYSASGIVNHERGTSVPRRKLTADDAVAVVESLEKQAEGVLHDLIDLREEISQQLDLIRNLIERVPRHPGGPATVAPRFLEKDDR